MEGHMALISLVSRKIKWPRLYFVRKPININKLLAFREDEKRIDKLRTEIDMYRCINCFRY
jgi:hypothetical protein